MRGGLRLGRKLGIHSAVRPQRRTSEYTLQFHFLLRSTIAPCTHIAAQAHPFAAERAAGAGQPTNQPSSPPAHHPANQRNQPTQGVFIYGPTNPAAAAHQPFPWTLPACCRHCSSAGPVSTRSSLATECCGPRASLYTTENSMAFQGRTTFGMELSRCTCCGLATACCGPSASLLLRPARQQLWGGCPIGRRPSP